MTGLKAALVRGVDVNITNTVGWTACHAAAAGGQTKALRYLVKKMGADITTIVDKGGNLAVHHAAKNGHVHALRTLQELGADVTKVRLSQAKGKAVRDLVAESYRKAGKNKYKECGGDDGEEEVVEAVGYARKQSRSTAFWGPRRTPISCRIKKKIIKDKRKKRKEKSVVDESSHHHDCSIEKESTRECDHETKEIIVPEERLTNNEEEQEEPSYLETVQQIKRSRKQKRRQRQKSRSNVKHEEESDEENETDANDSDGYKVEGIKLDTSTSERLISYECNSNSSGSSSEEEDDKCLFSANGQFAALALIGYDSDNDSE